MKFFAALLTACLAATATALPHGVDDKTVKRFRPQIYTYNKTPVDRRVDTSGYKFNIIDKEDPRRRAENTPIMPMIEKVPYDQ